MVSDRVIILGVDALEFDIVVNRAIEPLLQEEFGRVELPEMDQIHTQVIWPTFFTGLMPEEHGITLGTRHEWTNPVVRLAERTLGWVLPESTRSKIGSVLRSSGFGITYKDSQYFEDNDIDTLFSHVPATAISVPGYNEESINEEIRIEMHNVLETGGPFDSFIEKCQELFDERSRRVLDAVNADDRLVMAHLYTPDAVGHVCYNDPGKLSECYHHVGEFVTDVRDAASEEDLVIVVSDHGMKEGQHTPYGFYSVSKSLDWGKKIPITDFYGLILNELDIDTDDIKARRAVADHLEDLGYV